MDTNKRKSVLEHAQGNIDNPDQYPTENESLFDKCKKEANR